MARVIDLGSRWSPLIEGMGSLAGAYGGMLRKEKELESLEDMGLDFSTPEKSIESGYKLIEYNIKKGNIPEARQWYTILSEAEAARAAKSAPPKERDVQPLGEKQRESIESMIDKEFQTGWFDFMDPEIPGGFDKSGLADVIHYYSQSGQVQKSPAQVIKELKEGTLSINDLLKSGTMQQPSGGGSALMGTAPPVPSMFQR